MVEYEGSDALIDFGGGNYFLGQREITLPKAPKHLAVAPYKDVLTLSVENEKK